MGNCVWPLLSLYPLGHLKVDTNTKIKSWVFVKKKYILGWESHAKDSGPPAKVYKVITTFHKIYLRELKEYTFFVYII